MQLISEAVPQAGPPARQIGGESRTLGRFHKFRAFHTQQQSAGRPKLEFPAAPEDVAFVRQPSRRDTTDSSSTKMEWRYRGRAGSEAKASAEPLSAPTGINAQQSEGFQRFYKAVISPTHVRVTAGGRIVPNTRGTSPVSKQIKDKGDEDSHAKDGVQQSGGHSQQNVESAYLAAPEASKMPFFAFPSHSFYSPFHTSLPSLPVMPPPVGLGLPACYPGGFPISHQPGMPSNIFPFVPSELPKAPAKENLRTSSLGDSNSLGAPAFEKTGGNDRREASEQLDHPKLLLANGQNTYPTATPTMHPHAVPAPHPQFNPGYLTHPNISLSNYQGALMGLPPAGLHHFSTPSLGFSAMPASFPLPHLSLNQAGPLASTNMATRTQSAKIPQPPLTPAISSIRPSDISRKQIEMLRSSLKYHQDQLLYNRHQIDEKEMEHTVHMLQSQIDRFESLNRDQLHFEENHYPKKEAKPIEPVGLHARGSNRGSQTNTSYQGTVKHASGSSRRSESFRQKQIPRRRESTFSLFPLNSSSLLTDPVKKSTLPSRAALAPPFEPRFFFSNPRNSASREYGSFQCDGTAYDEGFSQPKGGDTVRFADKNNPCSFSSLSYAPDMGEPYLLGSLPAGIDPEAAKDADYVFERELTPNEARSRFLYLGRAPSFTRKGLPKFDGKNFYPASPIDQTNRHIRPTSSGNQCAPIGDANADCYTGALQAKGVQASQPGILGHYASDFRRERQKPVKVTLVILLYCRKADKTYVFTNTNLYIQRRPDNDVTAKPRLVNESSVKPNSGPNSSLDKGSKQDTVQPGQKKFVYLAVFPQAKNSC